MKEFLISQMRQALDHRWCSKPFQMLRCCFSDNLMLTFSRDVGAHVCTHACCMVYGTYHLSFFCPLPPLLPFLFLSLSFPLPLFPLLSLSSSQAKWSFSDNTRNGHLSVTILKILSDKPHVPLHDCGAMSLYDIVPLHVVKLESVMYGEPLDVGTMVLVLPLAASSGPQMVQQANSSLEQKSRVTRDTPLTTTAASDMPNELFGDGRSCSGWAEIWNQTRSICIGDYILVPLEI